MNGSRLCLICADPIERLHMRVAVCRACAVFFRRSLRTGHRFKCRIGYNSCNLKIKGQPLCKLCRFEKCKELGMKLMRSRKRKSQAPKMDSTQDQESYMPQSIDSQPEGVIQYIDRKPEEANGGMFSIFSPISTGSTVSNASEKRQVDMQPFEIRIKNILAQAPVRKNIVPGLRLTFLQQLCVGFPKFLDGVRTKETKPVIAEEFDRFQHLKFQEKFLLGLTKLLMKCDNFAELCFEDKWLLYKNAWMAFYKIERFHASVQFFGYSFSDYRVLYYDNIALDYSNKNIRLKDMEPENNEQWNKYWNPLRNKYIKTVLIPLKEMKLSQFELTYILAQILWNVGGLEGLSEAATRIAEEINSQIASEIHNYYVHECHWMNYAERLTKINKMIAATESILHCKRDLGTVAEIFNLWNLVIVGSELTDAG